MLLAIIYMYMYKFRYNVRGLRSCTYVVHGRTHTQAVLAAHMFECLVHVGIRDPYIRREMKIDIYRCISLYQTVRPPRCARRAGAALTLFMLVTAAVFQFSIGPYVVVSPEAHAVTADTKFASVMAVCAVTCTGSARSSTRPARRCDRNAAAQLHRKRHNVLLATRDVLHRRAT